MKTIGKLIVFILVISACSKDENNLPPEPENRPPGNFTVTTSIEGNNAEIMWTQASDPDGDTVSYSVVLEGNTILNGAANRNSVEAENLNFDTSYSGTVTASDPDGLTSTSNFSFSTGSEPNEAPEKPILTTPATQAIDIELLPELAWQAATDPDGDPVVYDIFLGVEENSTTQIATDISETTFTITDELQLNTVYYWKVRAKDDKGAMTDSDVFAFITNKAPEAFNLVSPENNATNQPLSVNLTWEEAVDPDGDSVVYNVYLDTNSSPSTLVADRIQTTNFVSPDLENDTQYYWRVVASDLEGGEVESAVFSFTTQGSVSLKQITDLAPFGVRSGQTSLVFKDKIWVIAGSSCCGTIYSDIWSSSDGENWEMITDNAPFGKRLGHASVVFDDKLWVIGGRTGFQPDDNLNDVWYTEDGETWVEATNNSGFTGRFESQLVVLNNQMYLIGGRASFTNDDSDFEVWSSENGVDWKLIADDPANFCCRGFRAVVFDNYIYYLGGFSDNVYRSSNGIDWETVVDNAAFDVRSLHTATVFDNKIWVIGGRTQNLNSQLSDIWYSEDGVNWINVLENNATSDFRTRYSHSTIVFNNKMWVLTGSANGRAAYGDIWTIEQN